MDCIDLVIPYPPSTNHLYRRSKTGGLYLPKNVQTFRQEVFVAFKNSHAKTLGRSPLKCALWLYPPDHRVRDLDGVIKSTWDALEHAGCFENDKQIQILYVQRMSVIKMGACKVRLQVIRDDDHGRLEQSG